MRKIIICLFVLILFSCSNDDDKIENPIDNPSFSVDLLINRWKYDQVNINGQQYLYGHQPNCQKDEFTFANNEGQIRQYSDLIFINDICSSSSTVMEWKIKEDKISLYFGTQKIIDYKVISLTSNSFVYSYVYDVDNDNIDDNIIIFAVPYE
ncbi:MAG: lipocalin family protein [Flavobacterium sp.]